MPDLIIVDSDTVTFLPSFGAATAAPVPTTISGSAAKTKVGTKAPCLEGDEKNVQAAGCIYTTASHVTPGTGTLKIDKLNSDQLTGKTTIEGKKVIVQGSTFDAVFEAQSPAKTSSRPSGPGPAVEALRGKGSFVPTNATVTAK